MKKLRFFIFFVFSPMLLFAQNSVTTQQYYQFLQSHQNITTDEILSQFAPETPYFSGIQSDSFLKQTAFLDSINEKLNLTPDEWTNLKNFRFMVTERLSFPSFGRAFHEVYRNDLPVFISTDAILQPLHKSYDKILELIEYGMLWPRLQRVINQLYETFPQLADRYQTEAELDTALQDVDLYVTLAKSLLDSIEATPHLVSQDAVDRVWKAVQAKQMTDIPLFSNKLRHIDFSQFVVRGHYTDRFWYGGKRVDLRNYFRAMMWLQRIDFFLTPPPKNPWEPNWTKADIRRMALGAYLLNELVGMADVNQPLNEMDTFIRFFVGESDNLTPDEFTAILSDVGISKPEELLSDATFDSLEQVLLTSPEAGQKILSSVLMMNPTSSTPDTLPVSYRVFGQRFIIDSYILGNLVYPNIIYENNKIWRPMPDPLDALFVLGNDDALPLLKNDLDKYHYATQAWALRYLVDSYTPDYWGKSLYNTWLQAIRLIGPAHTSEHVPLFMKTTAWHQEKLNTQLASWAQLRHDNLLYAKQSYTGGTGCSFPHSFVEPYPAFYRQIAVFAQKAATFLSDNCDATFELKDWMVNYFGRLHDVTDTLAVLAQKELNGTSFSPGEQIFLKKMLFEGMGSGSPPYTGWYADLYFDPSDAAFSDYVVADVHTQPTDADGNRVGRILHVGVGRINLGVFLAPSPSADFEPMAFVGPVFSYYEKITENFKRLTDEEWQSLVLNGALPPRPDWVNLYLTDSNGKALPTGRELPGILSNKVDEHGGIPPKRFALFQNYPNPFNPVTRIEFQLPRRSHVILTIFDSAGRKVTVLVDGVKPAGVYSVQWNASWVPSGVYFCRMQTPYFGVTKKLVVLR
ncbi:MAG: DUF3160 domain-containing protein [Calditrichaeota bacterium]|nr:DUF3160 domain-containing protein [Calditrichota bacterium]